MNLFILISLVVSILCYLTRYLDRPNDERLFYAFAWGLVCGGISVTVWDILLFLMTVLNGLVG